ncbi:MAG TPA: uroporphyrinogen decarboxylase [Acidimicrobiales bacterium]|nr:uroporphyrinogen decarboxylase [Acidimicrobiales bacterium]
MSLDLADSAFLRACRSQPVTHVPAWFMRQAGRSLPEYRTLRGTGSILDAIGDPALACEVTLQPVRRYGVDAAILFSDIIVPLHAIGFGVDVVPGTGPVIEHPVRAIGDLARLRALEDDDVAHVIETVRLVTKELSTSATPLIGFAGAPFTVASYAVEGGPTRTFEVVKSLAHGDAALFDALTDRLADLAIAFASAQVRAGASAIQLFDSWAGALSPDEYARFALPPTRKVVRALAPLGVPVILFGLGTGELLGQMATSGADVIGIDWHVGLDHARSRVGSLAVQGNLDPARCVSRVDVALAATRDVLRRAGTRAGHVFNLGHGVLPTTDPGVLAEVVAVVHAEGRAGVVSPS